MDSYKGVSKSSLSILFGKKLGFCLPIHLMSVEENNKTSTRSLQLILFLQNIWKARQEKLKCDGT